MAVSAAPAQAGPADRDHDGLSNRHELRKSHTNPRRADTDGDGLRDRFELRKSHTNPRRADTDGDGLRDRRELRRSHTNPRKRDTDGDGLRDRFELRRSHTNPRKRDTDGDGMSDRMELRRGTNPRRATPRKRKKLVTVPPGPGSDQVPAPPAPPEAPAPPGPPAPPADPCAVPSACPGPTAAFEFTPAAPHTGDDVTFDAGTSACPSPPCSYSWDDTSSGVLPLGSGSTMNHVFVGAGTRKVRLTVTDTHAKVDSVTKNVPVAAEPDTTAPETSITNGPSGTVTVASASFSLSSSEPGSTFQCRLDGGGWAGCTSPKTYSGLTNGAHTFDVRATDAGGNVDQSPATRTWTVDVTPPSPPASAFPTPATTGVPDNWVPTATTTGNLTVSTNGAVIDGRKVTGSILVRAQNVTIRNSRVYGQIYNQVANQGYNGLLVEDTEIGADSGTNNETTGAIGVAGYTARRVHIHNAPEGFRVGGYNASGQKLGGVVIEDSYVKLNNSNGCVHSDGIQGYDEPPRTIIRHNTIDLAGLPCTTGAIYVGNDNPGLITIENNLLLGGSESLRLQEGEATYDHVTGNRFVDGEWDYGPIFVDHCSAVQDWTDNRIVTIDANYNITSLGNQVQCNS
jgi:hypothetical protein